MSERESAGRILVIDDERNLTFVIQAMLRKAGYESVAFNDSTEALGFLESRVASGEEPLDAVITDLYMPGPDGMEVLELCQRACPALPVVFITAYGTVESAVAALKRGAFDFVTKPFDQAELIGVVQKAVQTHRQRQKEPIPLAPEAGPGGRAAAGQLPESSASIGHSTFWASPAMREVSRVIAKAAASPSTVLLTGESGTGKELLALELHRLSPRAAKPFIRVNCAAIPAELLESELFGHERGAFFGAVTARPGRFELAQEGTLFLDEVNELPLEVQVKLQRALQDHEMERVGGTSSARLDVRVIAATRVDLRQEVRAGRFREDLCSSLRIVPLEVPPLRERREDIDLLVRLFLGRFNEKLGKQIQGITAEALLALRSYPWPGNIRQLENALERMAVLCEGGSLQLSDLPEELQPRGLSEASEEVELTPSGESGGGPASFRERVKQRTQDVERDLIAKALEETQGNVTHAAERLGLSRKGLQLKMRELGLRRV